jgi:hypothetical protein
VSADWHGPADDPVALAAHLDAIPGVMAHGLFAPEVTSDIIIAGADAWSTDGGQPASRRGGRADFDRRRRPWRRVEARAIPCPDPAIARRC